MRIHLLTIADNEYTFSPVTATNTKSGDTKMGNAAYTTEYFNRRFPSNEVILTRSVSGVASFNGRSINATVEVRDMKTDDPSGRWVILINGVASRWYAMESVAVRKAKRLGINCYGLSYGEPA